VKCSAGYPIRNGKVYFIESPPMADDLDSLKYFLKRWLGRFYYVIGVTVFAPTFPFNYYAAIKRHLDPKRQLVVDIGAGNHRLSSDIITIDLFDYSAIDIVCDLEKLPFLDDSVDAFVSRSVLEHVPRLSCICATLARATRPNGMALHLIPFMFPFHASPHDYQRLTHVGAANLFFGFDPVEQRNITGPFTLLTLLLTEFFAVIFSFGKERLKAPLYLVFCLLLFPLKFLDWPFVGRSSMLGIAPTILTVSRKSSRDAGFDNNKHNLHSSKLSRALSKHQSPTSENFLSATPNKGSEAPRPILEIPSEASGGGIDRDHA